MSRFTAEDWAGMISVGAIVLGVAGLLWYGEFIAAILVVGVFGAMFWGFWAFHRMEQRDLDSRFRAKRENDEQDGDR